MKIVPEWPVKHQLDPLVKADMEKTIKSFQKYFKATGRKLAPVINVPSPSPSLH